MPKAKSFIGGVFSLADSYTKNPHLEVLVHFATPQQRFCVRENTHTLDVGPWGKDENQRCSIHLVTVNEKCHWILSKQDTLR